MPRGSALDKCHDAVKDDLMKKGLGEKEADGKAWGYCKKHVSTPEKDVLESTIVESKKIIERLDKEK